MTRASAFFSRLRKWTRRSRAPRKSQTLAILGERGVPVGTVLDVGVLGGTPELSRAFGSVKHILFEPVAEFAPTIRNNYRKLDYELVGAAVGDSSGSVTLEIRRLIEGMDISHAYMVEGEADGGESLRTVPKISLDDYLADKTPAEPFLLKIDIDGHEMQVLRGAKKTLKRCSVIVIECPGHALPERISALQKAGFRLFDLTEPCYYDDVFWQCDAVFVRNDIYQATFKKLQGEVDSALYKVFS